MIRTLRGSVVALVVGLGIAASPSALAQPCLGCKAVEVPIIDGSRIALVIGNQSYGANGWWEVPNAKRDADLIEAALAKAGFKVHVVRDGSAKVIADKVEAFSVAAAKADVAAVYYSGHGFEYQGVNYIVPIGAPGFVSPAELPKLYVPFASILKAGRAAKFSMFFLDACREKGPVTTTASDLGDLRWIEAPSSAVLFATASGQKSYSSAPPGSPNSPFAVALHRAISTEGSEISALMTWAAYDVGELTKSRTPPQAPQAYTSVPYRFFFRAPAAGPGPSAGVSKPEANTQKLAAPGATLGLTTTDLAKIDEPVLVAGVLSRFSARDVLNFAKAGDPVAQYLVGYFYAYGQGFQKDDKEALTWLERAAASGHPSGQLELAYFLARRSPDAATKAKALALYRQAAAQGFPKAEAHLAAELFTGALGVKDHAAAVELLRSSAAKGYPYSIFAMADYDDRGKSRAALTALADKGDLSAVHWLCQMAVRDKAWAQAAALCARAAQGGFADSRADLAFLYAHGTGVPRSVVEARYWAQSALRQPDLSPVNGSRLRALLAQMAPS